MASPTYNEKYWIEIKYCLPDYKTSVKCCALTSLDRLRFSQCKTKTADCGLWTADCGPVVKRRLSAKCRLQTESKTQVGCKMQNEDCRLFKHLCSFFSKKLATISYTTRFLVGVHCTFTRSFNERRTAKVCVLWFAILSKKISCRTSFFVVGMICSLFNRNYSFCTVFWVSSFYLRINIIVLYQFMVTHIENFEAWGLSEKRFKIAVMFLGCRRFSREERNGFVKADVK